MTAPPILRLSPEYGCWPTWDDATGDTLDPAELDLPPALVARIRLWDDAFQATLNHAYPPDSRFPDAASEAAWRAEGEAIFTALSDHLGAGRVIRREPL